MTDFELFIRQNGIKKKEIAQFFGSSAQFVSQLCSGVRSLPYDKLALLKQNTKGWDTTMLSERGEIIAGNNNRGDVNVQIGQNRVHARKKDSDEATQIAVLEKENQMLREQIEFMKTLIK